MVLPIAHATTAAPLAALLPARRGTAWQVGPAPYSIRNNAATSRITDGRRALVIAEQAGLVEVFADRLDDFAVYPDAVTDSTDPASVAGLAARALRWILPMLDAEVIAATADEHGWQRVFRDKGAALTEVGFRLVDHGATPQAIERNDGPGLAWRTTDGTAQWGMWSHGIAGTYTLTYDGPLNGLYGALPILLPPLGAHTSTDAGSAFTRHLTDRFPQLRPLDAREVEFGAHQDLRGWIVLGPSLDPAAPVTGSTRVCAEVSAVGIDMALATAPHLV
ncbi:hypothetical protein ABZV52_30050 [Streptomyces sp. NPDC004735]|uniref:hypothetical protein n=1 Tax=Streptomyces sp. NPDC004735 TaxID=3156654 RepID=UPI0033A983E0